MKRIERLNRKIGEALGFTPFGDPVYRWLFSDFGAGVPDELCVPLHPMRADGYDFRATPSGLIVAVPRFTLRKAALWLDRQWVICVWEPPVPESRWRAAFGDSAEWPKRGTWVPTNVDLDPGVEPNEVLTDVFIGAAKRHRSKSAADFKQEAEEAVERRERRSESLLEDIIRDSTTAFGAVPGKKGHVSFPGVSHGRSEPDS